VSGLVLVAKNKQAAARLTEDMRRHGQKEYVAAVLGDARKVLGGNTKVDMEASDISRTVCGEGASDRPNGICKSTNAPIQVQDVPKYKGILDDILAKDEKLNLSYVVRRLDNDKLAYNAPKDVTETDESDSLRNEAIMAGGKFASLEYEIIGYDEEYDVSYIKIHLITGRHHQIRVQLSSRGLFIVGDRKYLKRTSTGTASVGTTGSGTASTGTASVGTTGSGTDSSSMDSARMERAAKALNLRSRQIALCAYHLEVEGRVYEVEVPFMKR
jgi:23S rRNA-/tRNA-specific pseudouridylate synthase